MLPSLSRRGLFRGFSAACASLCPVCAARAAEPGHAAPAGSVAGQTPAPHWGYEGDAGPEKWSGLRPEFALCGAGREQTPIDLTNSVPAVVSSVQSVFQEMKVAVLNNGHTIQVNCPPGSFTEISGVRHELVQFHFHHPSEHLLAGKRFDLELHFVHRSAAGGLAVLGVFMKPGMTNATLAPIWAAMPGTEGPPVDLTVPIKPAALLPSSNRSFRYMGSLTTPPCSEGVSWTVFRESVEVSSEQIKRFAALFPANARPVQGLNRRFLLEAI